MESYDGPDHQSSAADGHDDELLNHYLSLPPARRRKFYVGTGRAAKLCGRTQRTVRFWIEGGLVQAFRLGLRNYLVEVESLRKFMHEQEAGEGEKNSAAKNEKNGSRRAA